MGVPGTSGHELNVGQVLGTQLGQGGELSMNEPSNEENPLWDNTIVLIFSVCKNPLSAKNLAALRKTKPNQTPALSAQPLNKTVLSHGQIIRGN